MTEVLTGDTPGVVFDTTLPEPDLSIDIDYEQLRVAMLDTGLSPEYFGRIGIKLFNRTKRKTRHLGMQTPPSTRRNVMPTFLLEGAMERLGQERSFIRGNRYGVCVGVDIPEKARQVAWWSYFNKLDEESRQDFDNYSTGDLLGLTLGHELRHVQQAVSGNYKPTPFFRSIIETHREKYRNPKRAVSELLQLTALSDVIVGLDGLPSVYPERPYTNFGVIALTHLYNRHDNLRLYRLRPKEVDAKGYIESCIKRGDNNPWMGIIKLYRSGEEI